jgi:hypothetical protein
MTKLILAVAAALAVTACSSDSQSQPNPYQALLQGTWARCSTNGVYDQSETMVFSGTSVVVDRRDHATTDVTCGGAGTATSTTPGTFVLGNETPATMRVSGATVTARAVDVTLEGQATMYSIIYVNAAAQPDLLYTADLGDAQHDGSTPDKRDNLLNDEQPFARQ